MCSWNRDWTAETGASQTSAHRTMATCCTQHQFIWLTSTRHHFHQRELLRMSMEANGGIEHHGSEPTLSHALIPPMGRCQCTTKTGSVSAMEKQMWSRFDSSASLGTYHQLTCASGLLFKNQETGVGQPEGFTCSVSTGGCSHGNVDMTRRLRSTSHGTRGCHVVRAAFTQTWHSLLDVENPCGIVLSIVRST